MTTARSRSWTDPRDGTAWTVEYNPPVELDTRRVRRMREGLFFVAGEERYKAPAPYGSALDDLTDQDLQGLLDRAREARPGTAWGAPGAAPGEEPES